MRAALLKAKGGGEGEVRGGRHLLMGGMAQRQRV